MDSSTSSGNGPSMKDMTLQVVAKLKGMSNWDNWRFCMRLILEEHKVLDVVEETTPEPLASASEATKKAYAAKNRKALIILASNVEASQMSYLKKHALAKDAWKEFKDVYQSSSLSNQLFLREKLRSLKQKEGEGIQEFSTRLQDVVFELVGTGATVPDSEQVLKLLEGLLPKYRMFVVALEAQGVSTLTFNDVHTRLLHEELRRHKDGGKVEQAYVAKQQPKKGNQGKPKGSCFYCGKPGHFKKDCFKWQRDQKHGQGGGAQGPTEHGARVASDNNFVFSATIGEVKHPHQTWYVDSGATKHMCFNLDAFSKLALTTPEPVYLGNHAAVEAVGVGDVPIITVHEGREMPGTLTNVLYVPKLAVNLLSVPQLVQKGMDVNFSKGRCSIVSPHGEVLGKATLDGNMYKLHTKDVEMACKAKVVATPAKEAQLWHERFGHIGMQSLEQLARKGLVQGLPQILGPLESVCAGCMKGKQARDSFPSSEHKAKDAIELIHADLCGPMSVPSLGHAKYFLCFTDDATRFRQVYFLQTKDEALAKFKEYKAAVELATGGKVKGLRTDRGSEFVNHDFNNFLAEHGIKAFRTAPYTPQQNGVS